MNSLSIEHEYQPTYFYVTVTGLYMHMHAWIGNKNFRSTYYIRILIRNRVKFYMLYKIKKKKEILNSLENMRSRKCLLPLELMGFDISIFPVDIVSTIDRMP